MLEIKQPEYFAQVVEFANKTGRYAQLKEKLDYLERYACDDDVTRTKCVLYKDFAPASFEFAMLRKDAHGEYQFWFNGGLLFHGAHDGWGSGAAPTLAVTLSPTDGWSIHT